MPVSSHLSHEGRWVHEEALKNIMSIFVTLAVFHPSTDWLNEEASANMAYIVVTLAVFHPSTGWLNEEALQNMRYILVTLEVSQREMFSLKSFCS